MARPWHLDDGGDAGSAGDGAGASCTVGTTTGNPAASQWCQDAVGLHSAGLVFLWSWCGGNRPR